MTRLSRWQWSAALLTSSLAHAQTQAWTQSTAGVQNTLTPMTAMDDLDGDGVGDLACRRDVGISVLSAANGALIWNRQTAFYPSRVVAIDDLDNDGVGDLLVASGSAFGGAGGVELVSGATSASLALYTGLYPVRGLGAGLAALDDLDGDQTPDFVVGSYSAPESPQIEVRSGATGVVLVTISTTTPVVGAVGDFNGDGKRDFAIFRPGSKLEVRSGADASVLKTLIVGGAGVCKLGDLSGDGRDDFAVYSDGLYNAKLKIFAGGSGALLHEEPSYDIELTGTGDVDGDQLADFVITSAVSQYTGGASGFGPPLYARQEVRSGATFASIGRLVPGGSPGAVISSVGVCCAMGDINGDGLGDLAVSDPRVLLSVGGASLAFSTLRAYSDVLTRSVGVAFGAGDGFSGSCPCGNYSAPGDDVGCTNSTGAGASLRAFGSDSLASRTLYFEATNTPPLASLFFVWAPGGPGSGVPTFDGLRVLGPGAARFLPALTRPDGVCLSGIDLPVLAVWSAGQTISVQAAYRDGPGPCGSGVNFTNGVSVTLTP